MVVADLVDVAVGLVDAVDVALDDAGDDSAVVALVEAVCNQPIASPHLTPILR